MTYLDHLKRQSLAKRDYGLPPDRKTDVDGWPLCTVCGVGRARQVTDDQSDCRACYLAAHGLHDGGTYLSPDPLARPGEIRLGR